MSEQAAKPAENHGQLMDNVYRHQRRIYDLTRKYYLLGRDHLIKSIDATDGQHILEVACGTGRNLAAIHRRYPDAHLYGFDISREMLTTAGSKLRDKAKLAEGDACEFDPQALFEQPHFDHIVLSYCLSMIPDWEDALAEALRHLAPGGTIHIVDFGDQDGLPGAFRILLTRWLAKFHVSPREDMLDYLHALTHHSSNQLDFQPLYRGYAQYAQIRRAV